MRLLSVLALIAPALCYTEEALASLRALGAQISQASSTINNLRGCGYLNTTQAISQEATVANGSACHSADIAISQLLIAISDTQNKSITVLQDSRNLNTSTDDEVIAAFQQYASAYYVLFNALDLAECTYILTPQSASFPPQFSAPGNLRAGFDAVIAELSHSVDLALRIAGSNLAQQTHFGGTSFLATQVGGPKPVALTACQIITTIVESEGGGTNRGT